MIRLTSKADIHTGVSLLGHRDTEGEVQVFPDWFMFSTAWLMFSQRLVNVLPTVG